MDGGFNGLGLLHAAAVPTGYLLGAIPFGLVLTRLAGLGDVRDTGSGNIGATNVLRTGHKGLAALTLILDCGKGAVAALALAWASDAEAGMIAGFAAVFGHNFPVWLKFRGGKGVATTLGVLLAVSWPMGVAACATWMLIAGTFRYSSLAALSALTFAPLYGWTFADSAVATMAAALGVLSVIRHHKNILRLLRGQETKIGQIPPPPNPDSNQQASR